MKTLLKKFLALSLKARVAAATIVVVGVTGGTTVAVVHHNRVIAHRNQIRYEASKDINKSSQNTASADNSTPDTNNQTATSATPTSEPSNTDSKTVAPASTSDSNSNSQASTAVTSNASSNSGSSSSGSSSKTSSNSNSSAKSSTRNSPSSGSSSSKTSSNSNSNSKSSTSSNSSSNKIVNDTITNPGLTSSNWVMDKPAINMIHNYWNGTTYNGSLLSTMKMSLNELSRGQLSDSDIRRMYLGKVIDGKYKIVNVYTCNVTTPKEMLDSREFYNNVKNAGLFNQTFSGIKFDDVETVTNYSNNVKNYRMVVQMGNI